MKTINLSPYIDQIEFEDKYVSDEYGTTTLYFSAPKEILGGEYPEAVSAEISLEFPTEYPEARDVSVCCSPTEYDAEEDAYTDYDWFDIGMSYDDIERLLDLSKKGDPL